MIKLERLHIIFIGICHVVIILGKVVLFARRKLGIPDQLLLQRKYSLLQIWCSLTRNVLRQPLKNSAWVNQRCSTLGSLKAAVYVRHLR